MLEQLFDHEDPEECDVMMVRMRIGVTTMMTKAVQTHSSYVSDLQLEYPDIILEV